MTNDPGGRATIGDAAGETLVRVATAAPFLAFLRKRRVDATPALSKFGLDKQALADPVRVVPANVVYGLLNAFAEAAEDPFLGVHVAETTPLDGWLFTQNAFRDGETLVAGLTRMIEAMPGFGRSVSHELQIASRRSTYRIVRPSRTFYEPAQADGLAVAMRMQVFDRLQGGWDPSSVTVRTPYIDAVPPGYRGVDLRRGMEFALEIDFPTAWCRRTVEVLSSRRLRSDPAQLSPPVLSDAMASALQPLLPAGRAGLKSAVAAALGMNAEELEKALGRSGTTFAREVAAFRIKQARRHLSEDESSISEIASRLGFSEAANFTRFFKREVGVTPSAFRRTRGG